MEKVIILLLILCSLLVACQPDSSCPKEQTVQKKEVRTFADIFGYKIDCTTPKGEANVMVYSPHIIGIWSTEAKWDIEYFKSLFIKKDGTVYFESLMLGNKSLETQMRKAAAPENRRLMMSIKPDNVIEFLVIHGIDEKTRIPTRHYTLTCKRGEKLSEFFSPRKKY